MRCLTILALVAFWIAAQPHLASAPLPPQLNSCGAVPAAPASLVGSVAGQVVTLRWSAPGGCEPESYVIEAGSAPGLANLASLVVGGVGLTVAAPPGRYHVRVRARNSHGSGAPSNEILVVVGSGCSVPGIPGQPLATTTATSLTIRWSVPTGGGQVSDFVLEFGSRPGISDLAVLVLPAAASTFAATAPPGRYYARLQARNACGAGAYTESIEVVVGRSLPATLPELLGMFGNRSERGSVRVFSTISQDFSDAHAAHGELTWNYFRAVFARSIGARTEMYYTNDEALYRAILAFCPTTYIPGARNLTACYDPAERIYQWVIMPYITPDFGTQLHELSHSFLYATYPASESFPWIKEGSGMYYESGSFVGPTLVVATPHSYLRTHFRRWTNAGRLLPLADLVRLPRDRFYTTEPTLVYSQAGMFYFYLMTQHAAVMSTLVDRLNARTLRDNDAVLAYLTTATGLSLEELDQAYRAYVRQF